MYTLTASWLDLGANILTRAILWFEPKKRQMRYVARQLEVLVKAGEVNGGETRRVRLGNQYAEQHIVENGRSVGKRRLRQRVRVDYLVADHVAHLQVAHWPYGDEMRYDAELVEQYGFAQHEFEHVRRNNLLVESLEQLVFVHKLVHAKHEQRARRSDRLGIRRVVLKLSVAFLVDAERIDQTRRGQPQRSCLLELIHVVKREAVIVIYVRYAIHRHGCASAS